MGINDVGAFPEILRQLREMQQRITTLERELAMRKSVNPAYPSVPSSDFADAPAAAAGQTHWFPDRTFPGAPNAGVLGVWSGTLWLASGQDVAGM